LSRNVGFRGTVKSLVYVYIVVTTSSTAQSTDQDPKPEETCIVHRAGRGREDGVLARNGGHSATLGSASEKLSCCIAIVDLAIHTLDIYRLPEYKLPIVCIVTSRSLAIKRTQCDAETTVVADTTYYDLLDIPAEATEAEIKKAYKRKVSLGYHKQ
jgi:hypothetical protein